MSMDRTLKAGCGLARIRSVLSRAERIKMLADEGKFDPTSSNPLGLPKVRVKHSKAGTKSKKAEDEAAEAAAPGAPAAAAPAAKGKAAEAPKGKAAEAPKGKAAAAKGKK